MAEMRTTLQKKADDADRELYGLIGACETMYDEIKRSDTLKSEALHRSLMHLRHARTGIRALMHRIDRERT